jgi:hypothetical protein
MKTKIALSIAIVSVLLTFGSARAAPPAGKIVGNENGGGSLTYIDPRMLHAETTAWMRVTMSADITVKGGKMMSNWSMFIYRYWPGYTVMSSPYKQNGRWYVDLVRVVVAGFGGR